MRAEEGRGRAGERQRKQNPYMARPGPRSTACYLDTRVLCILEEQNLYKSKFCEFWNRI